MLLASSPVNIDKITLEDDESTDIYFYLALIAIKIELGSMSLSSIKDSSTDFGRLIRSITLRR